jgi:hypothetical protein
MQDQPRSHSRALRDSRVSAPFVRTRSDDGGGRWAHLMDPDRDVSIIDCLYLLDITKNDGSVESARRQLPDIVTK